MPAAPPEPEAAPEPVPEPCANVISDDARINGSILAVRDLEIAGIVRGDIIEELERRRAAVANAAIAADALAARREGVIARGRRQAGAPSADEPARGHD